MGIYYTVTAGPVFVCKCRTEEKMEKHTKKRHKCPNGHKGSGGKFCPQCGEPISMIEEVKENRNIVLTPRWNEIYELMGNGGFREDSVEALWGGLNCERLVEDSDVLAPTSDKWDEFLGRKTRFQPNEFEIHARNIDPKAEVAKCEEFFTKELEYLRTLYESVHVEWMIVSDGK